MRQRDLARKAGVSQSTVSSVERGRGGTLTHDTLTTIAASVDGRIRVELTWRAGELDRLIDEDHASLSAFVAGILRTCGWEVHAEVTFSIDGERGAIDLLAWHASTATLLVVEVKTMLASAERLLRTQDVKVRLAPIVARRFGWRARAVARLVVLPATRTNRRRVRALAALMGPTVTSDAWAMRRWLRSPTGPIDGIWTLSTPDTGDRRRGAGGCQRVRSVSDR